MIDAPGIGEIRRLAADLKGRITRTPVVECAGLRDAMGRDTDLLLGKLEFLQVTGTFKARAALATLLSLSPEERAAGVTAVSAGNHAIATAFAAQACGVSAKVVMTASANPARVRACRAWGAEVVVADDVHAAFETAERIRQTESRVFVHPFEGRMVALGTGTLGLEICEQIAEFDALLVPVGGGGLIAGVSHAVRMLKPDVRIIGVEPEGADTMHRSFEANEPCAVDTVQTIADSLGAPFAMPYSFELTRASIDELCSVSDDQLRSAMRLLFHAQRMAVEPACAATTAALFGPLRESLRDKRVVLLFCGSNVDWNSWQSAAELED